METPTVELKNRFNFREFISSYNVQDYMFMWHVDAGLVKAIVEVQFGF